MRQGRIVKGIAGFYYVRVENDLYECKARGKFKKINMSPLVGDNVMISIEDEEKKLGIIEEIFERKTLLLRPRLANVEQSIIVFSAHSPDPNTALLDKLTVLSEYSGLDVIICMNKSDLDVENLGEEYKKLFESVGYRFIRTAAYTGEGIDELKSLLKDKVSVFSGPSGVGKSSLLNVIEEGMELKTGSVSEKTKRGKHTTRHSELFELKEGGYVVDTPGFTSLELDFIAPEEFSAFFPEFKVFEECRFKDCLHLDEPGCKIKEAMEEGKIIPSRYESYKSFMTLSINGGRYGTDSTIDTFSRFHKSGKSNKKR